MAQRGTYHHGQKVSFSNQSETKILSAEERCGRSRIGAVWGAPKEIIDSLSRPSSASRRPGTAGSMRAMSWCRCIQGAGVRVAYLGDPFIGCVCTHLS